MRGADQASATVGKFPQRLRISFRQRRIDIHPGPELEARRLVHPRHDGDIPVKMRCVLFLRTERADDEVERGIGQHPVDLGENRVQDLRQRGQRPTGCSEKHAACVFGKIHK